MAQPNWTWKANHDDSETPTDEVTMDLTNDRLQFGYNASDADSATLGNVTRPESGTAWADQLWHYDDSEATNKYQKIKAHRNPDVASGYKARVISIINDAACASTPYFTAYNTGDRSLGGDWDGTTSFAYPLIKGRYNGTDASPDAPTQYWGEASETAIKQKDVAGNSNPNGLLADTNYVNFNDATADTRYFDIALVVPSDFTPGTSNCRVSVRYTWT